MSRPALPVETELDALAWRLARACRRIVQSCLREDEWPDADREFHAVIRQGLEKMQQPVKG